MDEGRELRRSRRREIFRVAKSVVIELILER
jgi:hypothetical protein